MNNMKVQLIALVGLLATAAVAFAGGNAAPLGLELGATTQAEVRASLGKRVALVEKGTSKYSSGVILEGPGAGLDVEHLKRVTLIFDADQRLALVELEFTKGFGNQTTVQIADALQRKYTKVNRNIPSVGNGSARYTQGGSVIELNAPHMSFEFTVVYMTTGFERALRESVAKEASNRDAATRSRL